MEGQARSWDQWVFTVAALAVWAAMGWPFSRELVTGTMRGPFPVPPIWLLPFGIFGATLVGGAFLKLRAGAYWALLCAQLAAVVAMALIHPKDLMSIFLVIIAWQVAIATTPVKAMIWIGFQSLAIVGALSFTPGTQLSYIFILSLVLQLCCVLTAEAVKREAAAARALAQANSDIRSAQAIIASRVRNTERLRISHDLHDAWSNELTALGCQLDIAEREGEPQRLNNHVVQAKDMARILLAKVRDVVATLRVAEEAGGNGSSTGLTHGNRSAAIAPLQAGGLDDRHRWIFSVAALAVALTLAWPVLQIILNGMVPASAPLAIAFTAFVTAVLGASVMKCRPSIRYTLLCIQIIAVASMAFISSWPMMTAFLIIVAWQVGVSTSFGRALGWVAIQTMVVIGALALSSRPDLCWVIAKAFALQLLFVVAAQALRREEATAQTSAQINRELWSMQTIIANNARNAERLNVSRELHDAWGHELTALGLQLEIAIHVADAHRARSHVAQANELARALLGKVHDVVVTLQEDERRGLKNALEGLARSVPSPVVHVAFDPDVQVSPEQAHALMRCAQEAVTNAIRHSHGSNLWLHVASDAEGVRLIARDDGSARPAAPSSGSGLLGMRERLESLGGRLAVRTGGEPGFTVDAWLPSVAPQTA
ncbi:hypothetical protein G7A66_04445 [Altererythrobacter sp. SALINAS58]|uniref:ATP-binding protein n=1 Tax=Alteripontixanthobacter muriae TaxID=2705546 RepID=UPI0015769C9D|nr:histidine kinase [Alteripontixanthobacter muriae]NTZ42351.1 hypothetical protein [Alteripontixanthobacter muriae]